LATGRRAGAWKFSVLSLVLVGAAVLGSIFWLKRGEPGPPNAASFIATARGPTATQPQSNSTVAASSEAGASPQPAQAKVAGPNNQPIDLNARLSLNNPPHSDLAPTAIGAAQPAADASAGKPVAAPVNTPAVAAPTATPQPMASQSLEPGPVPTVSLPPVSTQIATPTPSSADSGAAVRSTDAPLPPVRPALKPAIEAAGVAQRLTPKLDLPTKLSNKSDARVVVAKAEATGAKAPAERSAPPQREASVKPEKGAKVAQAPTEAPAAAPAQQPVAAQQPSPNPVVRTFKNMVGAITGFIPFMPH
jgi:nicotinate-nucleotide--dimethylbenzimidazole phosphoribosyltransferase